MNSSGYWGFLEYEIEQNSSQSKFQFLENLNKKYIENPHIIMPPTDLFKKEEEKINLKKKSSNLDFYYCGTLSKHKNVY